MAIHRAVITGGGVPVRDPPRGVFLTEPLRAAPHMATNSVRGTRSLPAMYMRRRNEAIGTMSVNNAMLGVIDAGIMKVGAYYSVAARTRTNISACGVTVILRIICDL